jgi:hypothetical protein
MLPILGEYTLSAELTDFMEEMVSIWSDIYVCRVRTNRELLKDSFPETLEQYLFLKMEVDPNSTSEVEAGEGRWSETPAIFVIG